MTTSTTDADPRVLLKRKEMSIPIPSASLAPSGFRVKCFAATPNST